MHTLPAGIYTAAQVRELDRCAIERFGIPGYELMTRAGHATLGALRRAWPEVRSLGIFCGPGNNGGDGYVVARIARAQGLRVHVVALGDTAQLHGDARRAFDDFVAAGGRCEPWHAQSVGAADVLVDALFGTGLTREVDGHAAEILQAINASGRPVVAVDIPSGLHADEGRVLGVAARADLTVTFIGRKLGFYLGRGPDCAGRVAFDDLGVPLATYAEVPRSQSLIDETVVAAALPRRLRTAHKGRHGHALVVGGAPGMGGAPRLAGEAALRVGAGLVTVAVHPQSLAALASRPELMTAGIGSFTDLEHALGRASVVALGPGLGQSPWAMEIVAAVLATDKPVVVDADALNLLALSPQAREAWVLTPHPGEAARLLGTSVESVQSDRLGAATELQTRYGGTVVLKGAGSIVQTPRDGGWICDRGNPGMATAGMGDVLSGVIAGIASQCDDLSLAARAGVFVHAQAGDRAAVPGERGLTAGDVIDELRAGVNPR
ncbi:MAG TPA: NAD(P)H-hydrate dehydratase [Steroidobacteraceae bacterium]|nr:NAD(P)H-hydrate dehydratase [Steroidobacteraceae bacterium]